LVLSEGNIAAMKRPDDKNLRPAARQDHQTF
jgi:hypothetical protein